MVSPRLEQVNDADEVRERRIIDSWFQNASPWTKAVRGGRIESRVRVTDRAILDAVLCRRPRSALDVGCGEGWLTRAMSGEGVHAVGIDAIPELIEQARAGGGEFQVMTYEALAEDGLDARFDAVVCNFSLLGRDSVERLFQAVPALLKPAGAFIVQTLHPVAACGDSPYEDGWREGSWAGFGLEFTAPAPWYFRTLESWKTLFSMHGLRVEAVREPLESHSRRPASIIFTAACA